MGKVGIFWFSGTGNSKYVAELLQKSFEKKNYSVDLLALETFVNKKTIPATADYAYCVIVHPVHAFDTPPIVYDFIKLLPKSSNMKTVLLKTAAGGEEYINRAVSNRTAKALEKKGYSVQYDRTFPMGSNWLYSLGEDINRGFISIAKDKIDHTVNDIISGKNRRPHTNIVFRSIVHAMYLSYRWLMLPFISKDLTVKKSTCNNCGKCVRECPTENIIEKDGRIAFKWSCISCMKCLYSCPKNAINYRLMKPFKLKDGYNIDETPISKEELHKSKAYKNFKKYFENIEA